MYLTIKQQVKQLSKEDYLNLKELSHIAKNLANEAIYNVRQYYFMVIGFVRLNKNTLKIPYSYRYKKEHKPITINIPPKLIDKKVKEIRIIPKQNARFFEIQYIYEEIEGQSNLNKNHALAIDLGINNLATCVTSQGKSFIIDGRQLKLTAKRNNRVNDYISKSARMIVNYCLKNNIGILVCGYNETFQQNSNIGKKNNQIFTNLPFGKLREKLEYLCQLYGIEFIEKEESYTSKASFFDKDDMPMYNDDNPKEYTFSGKRVKRGLYQCANGRVVNADVNGALNILNKSRVVDFEVLYSRGEVDTPIRIRIV